MRDVAESDWKLFKKMLPQWQERYMEEHLNRDKLSSGVIANDIRRSTMHREIANLLIDSVITLDDLDGFTEDIKSYAQHWIGQ